MEFPRSWYGVSGRWCSASRLARAFAACAFITIGIAEPAAHAQQPEPEETRPDEMSDLVAGEITVSPEYPRPGRRAEIRLEVTNRAALSAERVEVAFFVDGTPLPTGYVSIGPYAKGTVAIPWAPGGRGVHVLSAVVDPRQRLVERDRLDNVATIDVVVASPPPAKADLAVADLEVISGPDRPTMLRVTVRNDGAGAASAPLVLRQNGSKVATVMVGPVERGEPVVVELPWGAARHGVTSAEINPRDRDAEPRSDNNTLQRDTRPAADLRVENLALHTTRLQPGQSRNVTVTFAIVNGGRQAVTRPFRSRIAARPKPGAVGRMPEPFHVTTSDLPAGGVAYVSHTLVAAPDQFDVTVDLDVDSAIEDADESNNHATMHFKNPAPDVDRWVSIGPDLITGSKSHGYGWNDATGRLSAIAIDPSTPTTMYVGAQGAGVWKTTDGGANWQVVSDPLTVRVAALAMDPRNSARLYLVTPNEGVFRTDDAGASWVQISTQDLGAIVHGGALLINPDNVNDMVLASDQGVYRSVDGGVNWQLKLMGGPATGLIRLPARSRNLYAAITQSTDSAAGVYESRDGGESWSEKEGCPGGRLPASDGGTIIRLAVSGGQLFASYRNNDAATWKLFRTSDTGCSIGGSLESSWEPGFTASGDNARVLWSGMWADPTDASNLYLGGTYFWRSTNNGNSFSITAGLGGPGGGAHVDHHAVATDPSAAHVIYSLNDGGIYRSDSRGASGSWKLFGRGISNVEFYDHASAPTQADLVTGGTQDNGTLRGTSASNTWTMIRGGDGATVDIDPSDPQVMYAMYQYADSIARSADGGSSFAPIAAGLPTGSVCYNFHYQVHPRATDTLLASCNSLWRTTDAGSSWTEILTPAAGGVSRSAIDGPANLFYAGTNLGSVSGAPGGSSWNEIFIHPGSMGVTDLELDLDDRSVLYVSFGGTGARRIYRLVRNGISPASFTARDISSDLPTGRAVRTLAIDRNHPFTLYAGTDKGVFRGRSLDQGQTWFWVAYMNGLPPADVRDLDVHPGTGVMRAATMGRSAFEVNTDHPMGSVLAIEGRLTFLRVHDVGTGFGPPIDRIDGEVVVKLDSDPLKAFGFQLRTDDQEEARRGMLNVLRDGLRSNQTVRVEYIRTGLRHGRIIRVVRMK